LAEVIVMKTEYDLSTMKRRGHPLRNKASRGEIKLISPLDISDRESKMKLLALDEYEIVAELIDETKKK
jgi:hypothetical protein